jgi:uncharacterized protein with FMN-binding domain
MTPTTRPPPTTDEQLAERLARLQQTQSGGSAAGIRPSPARRVRRHPAAGARAAALVLTLATTGGLGALLANLNSAHATSQALAALPAPIPTGSTSVPIATPSSNQTPASTPNAAGPQGFNGELVDTKYGPVQVQAQITSGAISDVAVVAYPNDAGKSRDINARALPQLRTEVLTAQQANVDTISGATYTSVAYRQSLQAAIDEARAAGATSIQ